jgi:choline dehydrogenase-like flavoprotein
MLLDGRSLLRGTCLRARTCIVGTGMGALSTARVLVEAGIDVILIEAGPVTPSRRDRAAIEIDDVGRPFRLASSRGLEVGGGTAFWHGVCAQLDESDFQQREWIPHSGWPIGSIDLAGHYQKAWDFLCGGDRSALSLLAAGLQQQPAAADILENKVYQFRAPPFRGKDLLLDWCKHGLARCVTHAAALQLVMKEGAAHRLIVGSGDRTFTVQAEVFIVAAGALETPRLLLNSQARTEYGSNIGNWWLGRNLIDHPAAYLSQVVFHDPVAARPFSGFDIGSAVKALPGFVIKPQIQRERELPNHALFIRPGLNGRKLPNLALMSFLGVRGIRDLRSVHLKALLTDRYIRWRVLQQRLKLNSRTHYGDLFFMTEQLPNPVSRVDLSERKQDRFGYPVARINWQLSRNDVNHFGRFLDLLMESLDRHPGVSSLRKDGIGDWLGSVSSAAHHLGTARMAASPADGVVDANLKVFTTNNVWVCDGSVFPTAGSVNPSLTICALGHRLGSHLLDRG